jgi:hypothetical protein
MSTSPLPPPPHTVIYSQDSLNPYRPASTQREVPKNPRAPLRSPVLCPIAVAHNTESVHIFLQDLSIPEAYTLHQNTGKFARPLNHSRTPTPNTLPAPHSSTLCSNGGSSKPLQHHHVRGNSSSVRIPPGNSSKNAPMLTTSPAAQNFTSNSNDGSPRPLKQADVPRNSPAVRISLASSNGNSSRLSQYTKFHHPLPPVPRTSSLLIYEPRRIPSVPNTRTKRQPYTSSPTKPRSILLSEFPDAAFVDKHTLRQTLSSKSTLSKNEITESSTSACTLEPVIRTESDKARVGEYRLIDVHHLSQHAEISVEVESSSQMNEETQRCAGEKFQRRAKEELQRRAREEAQRLTSEKAQRRAEEVAQCLAKEEAQRRAEEEDQRRGEERVEAAWNQDLSKRGEAWRERIERRQEAEIIRNMADARGTAEAQAMRQNIASSRIQGPRQKTAKPEPKPKFSSDVPADAVLNDSSEQRRREEWAHRGDELRRKLEQMEREVWGDEDARRARREEEARRKKMEKAMNEVAASRTTEAQVSRQTSPGAGTGLELLDYIPPNTPIVNRDTERRIADAIRDGYLLLARALEDEARRSQYPMNMIFNGDGNSVNVHSVHASFQGKAARRAARIAEGRNGWRERAKEKAYEWFCTVM